MPWIKITMVAFIVSIIAFLMWDYSNTKADLQAKKAELQMLSLHIEEQNNAIKALEIDIQAYKNKKPQIIEKIVTKYQEVQVKDNTCEAAMEAIFESQLKFFDSVQGKQNIKEQGTK